MDELDVDEPDVDEVDVSELPTDPDIDLKVRRQRAELARTPWVVLSVIAAGGACGALARYGVGIAIPPTATGFPWATFLVNCVGCLLIGVLMVLVADVWGGSRLIRPFLGVGVLGGFTTFSTYVVDVQRLVNAHAPDVALVYLFGTVIAAVVAVYAGVSLTRSTLRLHRRRAR